MNSFHTQAGYDIRCEWGLDGLHRLLPECQVIILLDVLSFTTCVDIATSRGALIYPYPHHDDTARRYAESLGAEMSSRTTEPQARFTLSAHSLLEIPPGTRLVLPSPNGSRLSHAAAQAASSETVLLAGCLRNARAVARAAAQMPGPIGLVPAGELWEIGGQIRPSLEDMLGAGAISAHLPGSPSPEAELTLAVFERFHDRLPETLRRCSSGQELIQRGRPFDVDLASQFNTSSTVPHLLHGAYQSPG